MAVRDRPQAGSSQRLASIEFEVNSLPDTYFLRCGTPVKEAPTPESIADEVRELHGTQGVVDLSDNGTAHYRVAVLQKNYQQVLGWLKNNELVEIVKPGLPRQEQ